MAMKGKWKPKMDAEHYDALVQKHAPPRDGRVVYEGEMRDGWTEYEFTLDAVTGTILEWDVDRH